MDRRACKAAAKAQAAESGNGSKLATLIFLLSVAALVAISYAAGTCLSGAGNGLTLNDQIASRSRNMVISFGLAFILQMLLILLTAGYASMALHIRSRQEVSPKSLLEGFSSAGRIILLYILKGLRLMLWTYAFSIPAVYLLVLGATAGAAPSEELLPVLLYIYVAVVMYIVSYRYRLAYFSLLEHSEFSAGKALRWTAALTRGHRKELFLLDLSFLPWMLLSALTGGILLIWKLPYISATYANVYDTLTIELNQRQARLRELMEQQRNFGP